MYGTSISYKIHLYVSGFQLSTCIVRHFLQTSIFPSGGYFSIFFDV
nr:MAG TPA: hypothetical protein [Caudoviricetes sp.]